jgi:hypothetical protein
MAWKNGRAGGGLSPRTVLAGDSPGIIHCLRLARV